MTNLEYTVLVFADRVRAVHEGLQDAPFGFATENWTRRMRDTLNDLERAVHAGVQICPPALRLRDFGATFYMVRDGEINLDDFAKGIG